jgi:hypothetical protein
MSSKIFQDFFFLSDGTSPVVRHSCRISGKLRSNIAAAVLLNERCSSTLNFRIAAAHASETVIANLLLMYDTLPHSAARCQELFQKKVLTQLRLIFMLGRWRRLCVTLRAMGFRRTNRPEEDEEMNKLAGNGVPASQIVRDDAEPPNAPAGSPPTSAEHDCPNVRSCSIPGVQRASHPKLRLCRGYDPDFLLKKIPNLR